MANNLKDFYDKQNMASRRLAYSYNSDYQKVSRKYREIKGGVGFFSDENYGFFKLQPKVIKAVNIYQLLKIWVTFLHKTGQETGLPSRKQQNMLYIMNTFFLEHESPKNSIFTKNDQKFRF